MNLKYILKVDLAKMKEREDSQKVSWVSGFSILWVLVPVTDLNKPWVQC